MMLLCCAPWGMSNPSPAPADYGPDAADIADSVPTTRCTTTCNVAMLRITHRVRDRVDSITAYTSGTVWLKVSCLQQGVKKKKNGHDLRSGGSFVLCTLSLRNMLRSTTPNTPPPTCNPIAIIQRYSWVKKMAPPCVWLVMHTVLRE